MARYNKEPGFNFLPESEFKQIAEKIMPDWEANFRSLSSCVIKSQGIPNACIKERSKALTLTVYSFCRGAHDTLYECQKKVNPDMSKPPTFKQAQECNKQEVNMFNCLNVYEQKMMEYVSMNSSSTAPLPPRT
eukprot:TRINITY_DN6976_c0_g1_i1.p1 TRINITY_DN6976_c0_g1~~TRINITY_DN6976_c0_g1_i1.p1  ORF type:complete len:142 (+),score=4.23 TRINITY_DN6976_c0_g1_i1:28-426(+)